MADHREVATWPLIGSISAAPGETLFIVTDTDTNHIDRTLFEAGVNLGLDSRLLKVPPMERNGMEPPESAVHAMESADIMVCPTSISLTHARARKAVTEIGTHVATIPGITDQMFGAGAITVSYEEVERLTAALTEKLITADETRIEAGGASATMSLLGRDGIPSDGIIAGPGNSGNLPSDRSYVTPVEGATVDTSVFDGGFAGVGVLDGLLVVELDARHITSVEDMVADEFLDATGGDDCTRWACEFGLGTNPAVSTIGIALEDKKAYDTCHVAFGDDLGFGGIIDYGSHPSGATLELTASFDGDIIVAGDEVRV